MTSVDYATRLGQVTRGLQAALIINRLSRILYCTIEGGGEAAEEAFREAVADFARADRAAAAGEAPPPSPAPGRR